MIAARERQSAEDSNQAGGAPRSRPCGPRGAEDGSVQQQLHAIYLDPVTRCYSGAQLVLRLRKEDGLWVQALRAWRQALGAAGARGSCALAGR